MCGLSEVYSSTAIAWLLQFIVFRLTETTVAAGATLTKTAKLVRWDALQRTCVSLMTLVFTPL